MRLSLQQNNLILETQQCSFSNYFKSLLPNQSKLFFSLREQFIYQITVISCTVSLLLPHTHPNKPPTSAFPNETTTSITSGLILLWFIACTSHTHTPPSLFCRIGFSYWLQVSQEGRLFPQYPQSYITSQPHCRGSSRKQILWKHVLPSPEFSMLYP